ncbi:hypothetical protein [Croceicoccus gelatinilyticus]|uniref:hypothetical protein n=1 Tax=Croceicoccus gelatinilyticus TaxID=2835536 RepID=UPI001BCC7B9C|nr:hypothetical protein [Croceicoccus gelatinilyticus]MBS7671796.1 hypothetical protein [Croceicoccus gelatinilyticus]
MDDVMQASIDLIVLSACLSAYLAFTIFARKGSWFAIGMVLVLMFSLFLARSTSASLGLIGQMPIVFAIFTLPLIFGGRAERLASVILIAEFVVVAILRVFVPIVLTRFDTAGAVVDALVLVLLTIGAQRHQGFTMLFCASLYLVQIVGHVLMLIGPNLPEDVYHIFRTSALPILAFFLQIFCLPYILRIWRLRTIDAQALVSRLKKSSLGGRTPG